MSADLTWLLNGIDLDQASGRLAAVSLWRPPLSVRRSPITIPGAHGSLDPGLPVFEEPTVTIGVSSGGHATQAALEAAVNNVVGLLAQPTLTLTRVSGGITTSAPVKLVSADLDDGFLPAAGGTPGRAVPVAVLAIPSVFLRETVSTGDELAFNTDLTNQQITHLAGSTGPIVDPIIRIQGPCAAVTVTDPGTGTGLSWAGTLAAGQYLFLCPRPLSARISSTATAWTTGGTSELANVGWPAAGRLQLWPVVAGSITDRRVLVTATGAGRTAATKLTVRAGRSFL